MFSSILQGYLDPCHFITGSQT